MAACTPKIQLCQSSQLEIQSRVNCSDPRSFDHQKQRLVSTCCRRYACSHNPGKRQKQITSQARGVRPFYLKHAYTADNRIARACKKRNASSLDVLAYLIISTSEKMLNNINLVA